MNTTISLELVDDVDQNQNLLSIDPGSAGRTGHPAGGSHCHIFKDFDLYRRISQKQN